MRIVILFLLLLLPNFAHAENIVHAELIVEQTSPELKLAVVLHHPDGWHTYYKNSGDAGLPTSLTWSLPKGFSASDINWPNPQTFKEGNLTTYGYTGEVKLPVVIKTPSSLRGGDIADEAIQKNKNKDWIASASPRNDTIKVKASWLVCKDVCVPETQELILNPAGGTNPVDSKAVAQDLFFTLLLAILGGLILNLMPCVLPVLSLKALALVKKSGKEREHTAWHGIAYTLGILASFAALAAILLVLQKGGQAVGWGYQMQFPAFVGFLIYLLFAVGLSLSGAFHLPILLGGVGADLANEGSLRGSFFTGVMAALVATPCTAPFMASAVGAALTLPEFEAMLVFLSLGLGLALPFLLISIFPSCLRFLPKQGAWMERFKELLAFPIYASVIWLLWVLDLQAGAGAVAIILAGMLFLVFALWLKKWHFLALILAGLVMIATLVNIEKSEADNTQIPYSKQSLNELRAQGKAVFVDATAAWCITCQINKRVVLDNPNVRAAFAKNNVTLMVADWTKQNPEITEFLHEFHYNGVPLNVFYSENNAHPPIVLPQILHEDMILELISTNPP